MAKAENYGRQFDALIKAPIGSEGTFRVGDVAGNPNVKFWDYDVAKSGGPEKDLEESKTTKRLGIKSTTLYDSIKEHGVAEPIHISAEEGESPTILSGHHRIAAANDINPDMRVPFIKMPANLVMPGYMTAKGNCPSCQGDGQDWENEEAKPSDPCPTCHGNGWVKPKGDI